MTAPSFVATRHITDVLVTQDDALYTCRCHSLFLRVDHFGICLQCLFPYTNCPSCDAGTAGMVEPLSHLWWLQYSHCNIGELCFICPHQDPSIVTNNEQVIYGYMKISL